MPMVGHAGIKKKLKAAQVSDNEAQQVVEGLEKLTDQNVPSDGIDTIVQKSIVDAVFRANFINNPSVGLKILAKEAPKISPKAPEKVPDAPKLRPPPTELPPDSTTDQPRLPIDQYRIEIATKGDQMQVYDTKIFLILGDENLAPGDGIVEGKATLYFCPDNLVLPANRFIITTPEPDPNLAPGDSPPPTGNPVVEAHVYFHNRQLDAILDLLRNEKYVTFFFNQDRREAGIDIWFKKVG